MGNYWIIHLTVETLIVELSNVYAPYIGTTYASETALIKALDAIKNWYIQKHPKYSKFINLINISVFAREYINQVGDSIWKFEDFEITKVF